MFEDLVSKKNEIKLENLKTKNLFDLEKELQSLEKKFNNKSIANSKSKILKS